MRYVIWRPSKQENYLYLDQWFADNNILLSNHFLIGDILIDGSVISSFIGDDIAIPELFEAKELEPLKVIELISDKYVAELCQDNSIKILEIINN